MKTKIKTLLCLSIPFLMVLTSCTSAGNVSKPAPIVVPTKEQSSTSTNPVITPTKSLSSPEQTSGLHLGLTYQQPDGNRVVQGEGGSEEITVEIQLAGKPMWLVSLPYQEKSIWYVALEDGSGQAFEIEGEDVFQISLETMDLPAGQPPVLKTTVDGVALLPQPEDGALFSHPILLNDGRMVYLSGEGDLITSHNEENNSLEVNALPDARILSDGTGRVLFLTGPTENYPHDVLGDAIEASSITLVDFNQDPAKVSVIEVPPGEVIEGISPLWVDLDGDGSREIVVTQSNDKNGARLVVYREDGSQMASGEAIGLGFRWRHQLAAAQFVSGGPLEIAVTRTPHISGVVEIYQIKGDQLEIVTSLSGYSTHRIDSRNLDSALVMDLNGDGLPSLVVPDQEKNRLVALQMNGGELKPVWFATFHGKLITNLSAVSSGDGIWLGAGTTENTLKLWFFR